VHAVEVRDVSQVAQARRCATETAATIGADEAASGRIAIVATELASNLIKHGGGGELLVSNYEEHGETGVQLIALDRGRGIANLQECLRDGYSTAGSAGHGLGAVKRQSSLMEVASWSGVGTAVLAQVSGVATRATAARPWPTFGSVAVPIKGEEVCGDACVVRDTNAGRTMIVADGLGHGAQAATAAMEAIRLFIRHQERSVPEILEYVHAGLRATRGAAIALARFDAARSSIVYGGIGNIVGSIVQGSDRRRMISLNGTAGHVARRIQTFDYPFNGGLVIMQSDGLTTDWSLDRYPGITRMHPTLIAAVLYRDFSRGRDDASVLVSGPRLQ
jgi:anti-sigma regulatory factor (Ser/Thr protein kinase)